MRLNGLDLFSGIGGISLALKPWVRTVCYVEIDRYCQALLAQRMEASALDAAPVWDDIRTFDAGPWRNVVDIIAGGFPCQDISTAGRGAGLEGERSGLWWQMHRIVARINPAFVFIENTPPVVSKAGFEVASSLDCLGYVGQWGIFSAEEVGFPHERRRWFCFAAHSHRLRELQQEGSQPDIRRWASDGTTETQDADLDGPRLQTRSGAGAGADDEMAADGEGCRSGVLPQGLDAWLNGKNQPLLGREVHGLPHRVDRIRGLGNSVVPQCAREAFKKLSGLSVNA